VTAPVRTVAVEYKATGVAEVQAATRAVQRAVDDASTRTRAAARAGIESAADRARDRWDMAGREISKTMVDLGRTGELTGGSLKKLVVVGSEMAVMFSPAGPVASAVALLTLGIVSMFKRARDEQAETQRQFIKGLQDMAAASDYAAIQSQAGKLWRGTFNTTTGKFEGGARDLLSQERSLQSTNPFDLGAPGRLKNFYNQKVTSPLDGQQVTVQQLLEQYRQTITLMQMPLDAPRGPRSPITITASSKAKKEETDFARQDALDLEASKGRSALDWKRRMEKIFGSGPSASDAIGQALNDPTLRAKMFAGLANPGSNQEWQSASSTPVLSALLPSDEQLNKELDSTFKKIGYWVTDNIDAIKKQFATVGQTIADTIGQSLNDGLHSAFEVLFSGGGISNAFRALGQMITRNLATLFADLAVKAMGLASLFAKFQTAMASMNPWAAVAIAGAMLIAAQALGGSARGFGAGSSAASAASSAASAATNDQVSRIVWGTDSTTVAAGLTPRSATNITIIGPNDPSAQRAVQEILKNANRRGG
jgi:hypothetical protein